MLGIVVDISPYCPLHPPYIFHLLLCISNPMVNLTRRLRILYSVNFLHKRIDGEREKQFCVMCVSFCFGLDPLILCDICNDLHNFRMHSTLRIHSKFSQTRERERGMGWFSLLRSQLPNHFCKENSDTAHLKLSQISKFHKRWNESNNNTNPTKQKKIDKQIIFIR